MRVACIGTRNIDENTRLWLMEIGRNIITHGHSVLSGNAVGSDQAYADGAKEIDPSKITLFLPWSNYNEEAIPPGSMVVRNPLPIWKPISERNHPVYEKLKRGAKSLMDRNAGIVSCCDILMAVRTGSGGTEHGWSIGGELLKPRLDLSTVVMDDSGLAEVVEWIEEHRVNFLIKGKPNTNSNG